MTDLSRLRSALASFDAGPAGSLDLVRRLADVLDAAREACADPPPAALLSPDVPPWIVLSKVDADPIEISTHASERQAREFYDRASANWSEVYLCQVVAGPGPTSPHDAPAAVPLPDDALTPGEARTGQGRGVDEFVVVARSMLPVWAKHVDLSDPNGLARVLLEVGRELGRAEAQRDSSAAQVDLASWPALRKVEVDR